MATALKIFMGLTEQVGNVFEVGNTIWGFIGKIWKFPSDLDQNVNHLKRKREELNGQKEDTESIIKAELRPRKKVKKEVELWMENVKRVDGEIENLESEALRPSGICNRGFLNKNVCKKIEEVDELLEKGRSSDAVVVDDPSRKGQPLPTPNFVCGTIANKRMEILDYLKNNKDKKIGIYGMPGVGKTSVIKLVNNELLKDAEFNIVLWVSVSSKCSAIELQNKIALAMNAVISEDGDEKQRAGMLSDILGQKGKYALILDDVWEYFSLEEIGIPEPTASNGSKLVLATQSLDVCRRMGCREIKMERLPEADAWALFSNTVGQNLMSFADLVPIARSVAEHCTGWPLAIIMVASSMKGEYDLPIWRNTLNELNGNNMQTINSDFKDTVVQQLRFSYDRLNDPKIQKCFLSCASHPEDSGIPEEQLIMYWIKQRFIDDMGEMEANMDRGKAILRTLVDNCLLENVENEKVTMHDLVRDMAIRIIQELHSS